MAATLAITSDGDPRDLLEEFTQFWAEGHRLIHQVWSQYPLLAGFDIRLGRIYSEHCLASLAVAQAYAVGAASPAALQQAVTTFNHLTDQVEQIVGEAFGVLLEYADAVVAQLPLAQADLGDLIGQHMLAVKQALTEPSFQSIDGVHLLLRQIDVILAPGEAALKALADASDEASEDACGGAEALHV